MVPQGCVLKVTLSKILTGGAWGEQSLRQAADRRLVAFTAPPSALKRHRFSIFALITGSGRTEGRQTHSLVRSRHSGSSATRGSSVIVAAALGVPVAVMRLQMARAQAIACSRYVLPFCPGFPAEETTAMVPGVEFETLGDDLGASNVPEVPWGIVAPRWTQRVVCEACKAQRFNNRRSPTQSIERQAIA